MRGVRGPTPARRLHDASRACQGARYFVSRKRGRPVPATHHRVMPLAEASLLTY